MGNFEYTAGNFEYTGYKFEVRNYQNRVNSILQGITLNLQIRESSKFDSTEIRYLLFQIFCCVLSIGVWAFKIVCSCLHNFRGSNLAHF